MASDFTYKIDTQKRQRLFKKLEQLAPNQQSRLLKQTMRIIGLRVENRLKTNVSGPILRRRTGHFTNSMGSRVDSSMFNISVVVGSGVRSGRRKRQPQANILETGGTIKAKRGKYLAIPLPAALTKAGAPRKGKTSPRDWPNTFVNRSKKGNLIIFQKKGKRARDQRPTPLYVLKKQVKIPDFMYLTRTRQQTTNGVLRILAMEIERAVK